MTLNRVAGVALVLAFLLGAIVCGPWLTSSVLAQTERETRARSETSAAFSDEDEEVEERDFDERDFDEEENYEDEDECDEEYDELYHELFETIELTEDEVGAAALAIERSGELLGEEEAIGLLEQSLHEIDHPHISRMIRVKLIQLYDETERTDQVKRQLRSLILGS